MTTVQVIDLEYQQTLDRHITNMLLLEPYSPTDIILVDSEEMALNKIQDLLEDEVLIGVTTAVDRHRIAYKYNVDINKFRFIRGANSLEIENPEDKHLILWDFIDIQTELAQKVVYSNNWRQVSI